MNRAVSSVYTWRSAAKLWDSNKPTISNLRHTHTLFFFFCPFFSFFSFFLCFFLSVFFFAIYFYLSIRLCTTSSQSLEQSSCQFLDLEREKALIDDSDARARNRLLEHQMIQIYIHDVSVTCTSCEHACWGRWTQTRFARPRTGVRRRYVAECGDQSPRDW